VTLFLAIHSLNPIKLNCVCSLDIGKALVFVEWGLEFTVCSRPHNHAQQYTSCTNRTCMVVRTAAAPCLSTLSGVDRTLLTLIQNEYVTVPGVS